MNLRMTKTMHICLISKTIPIVAMSANAFAEDVEESLKSGMNAHISKPIKVDEMLKEISKFL